MNQSWPNLRCFSDICAVGLQKPTKTLQSITRVRAEIRAKDLMDTKQDWQPPQRGLVNCSVTVGHTVTAYT
jgi:hypothetical protein